MYFCTKRDILSRRYTQLNRHFIKMKFRVQSIMAESVQSDRRLGVGPMKAGQNLVIRFHDFPTHSALH